MGNILCVPKRKKTRPSTDGPTGGRFSRWISGKFRRPSSTEDQLPLPGETDEVPAHAEENNVLITVHSPDSSEESLDYADHHANYSLASIEGKSPSPVLEETTETTAIQRQAVHVSLTTAALTATTKEVSLSRCVISDRQSNHDTDEIEPTTSQNESDVSAKHQPKMMTLATALPEDIGNTHPLKTNMKEAHLERSVAQLTDNDEIRQTPSESTKDSPCSHVLGTKTLGDETSEPDTEQNNTASPDLLSSKTEILDIDSLNRQRNDQVKETNKENTLTCDISEKLKVEMKEICDRVKDVKNAIDTYNGEGNQGKRNTNGIVAARHGEELISNESVTSINSTASKMESVTMSLTKLPNVLKTETDDRDGPIETYSNEPKLTARGEKRIMPVAKAVVNKMAMSEDCQEGDVMGRRSVMKVTTKSNSQNKSKVSSNEPAKRKPEIGGISTKSKQIFGIAPAKSFYRLDNEPTQICRKHSLCNGVQFQLVKRKVSDFKVPQLPPLLPDVPIQLYRKPHVYGIPNVARDGARGKVTWRQIENKSSYGGQFWTSKAPVFEPPAQSLGERLLELYGSVAKMRRSWLIPQCRQIETLKLENDIYPGQWVCPDMRWRYNMDTNTERGNATNRRQCVHRSKTNDAVRNRQGHQNLSKSRSKAKGGNLARWSRYDDLSTIYGDIM